MRDLEYQAPSPEERLLWEEEVAGLLAAMAELSPSDREVIGLCYGSEISMAEAGEILGLSAAGHENQALAGAGTSPEGAGPMKELPDDLRDLDRKLRSVRFGPRASFGPELLGRLRRGDRPSGSGRVDLRRHLATAAVAVLTAGGALALANLGSLTGTNDVTVDRCCYDLDGGGGADDGVFLWPSATPGCTVSVSMRIWTAHGATRRET